MIAGEWLTGGVTGFLCIFVFQSQLYLGESESFRTA